MTPVKPIPFMRYRNVATAITGTLVLLSLLALIFRGVNYGLDFTGGTQVEVSYAAPPELEDIRRALADNGFPNNEVVFLGTDRDVTIRLQNTADPAAAEETPEAAATDATATAQRVIQILRDAGTGDAQLESSSYVGSQVGDDMKEQGSLGMLVALGMIMIYITLRFQFKFAVGSVISLVHDTILTLGFFAITQLNFDLTVLAALLAVVGYSINDTIVVADRIRENFRILRGYEPAELIDISITQTMARSIITSLTTVLVLLALFFFGGESVRGFSVTLIVGIFFGTTSSIYVAASTLMYMHITKEDLMPKVADKAELDALP